MRFVRVGDAAEILDVSEGLLRKLIAQGKIPSYKLSEKTTRIDLDELRNYMRVITVTSEPKGEDRPTEAS
jgi:excisionase family DNA binding protein